MQSSAFFLKVNKLRYTEAPSFRDTTMEYWQEFIRYEHANSIMIALGVLLVFVSIMKILKSSFKLLLWVILAGLGTASLSYGFQHSPYDLPKLDSVSLPEIQELAPNLNTDVLEFLCEKFDSQ